MVHILTDTMAGLSLSDVARYDISVVPQVLHFGEDSFLECQEMDVATFFRRLVTFADLPKTLAPPPDLCFPHLRRFAADGEPILCIHP